MKKPKKAPAGKVVTLQVAGGSYKAKLVEQKGYKVWTGTEGIAKGVLLKMESKHLTKALAKKPVEVELKLGAKVRVKKLVYSDKSEMWASEHAVIKALQNGMAVYKSKYAKIEVTRVETEAKPLLKW